MLRLSIQLVALVSACVTARRTTSTICLRDYSDDQCSNEFEATDQQSSVTVDTCQKVGDIPIVGGGIYRKIECNNNHTLKVSFHRSSGCNNAYSVGNFQEVTVSGCTQLGSNAQWVLGQIDGIPSSAVSGSYHVKFTCSACTGVSTSTSAWNSAIAGVNSYLNGTSTPGSWSATDRAAFDAYVAQLAAQAQAQAQAQGTAGGEAGGKAAGAATSSSMDAYEALQWEQTMALLQAQLDQLRANGGSADDILTLTQAIAALQDANPSVTPEPGQSVSFKIVNSVALAGVDWRSFQPAAQQSFKSAIAAGLSAFEVDTSAVHIKEYVRRDLSVYFEVTFGSSRYLAASAAASLDAYLRNTGPGGFLVTLQNMAPAGFSVTGVTVLRSPMVTSQVVANNSDNSDSDDADTGLVITVVVLSLLLIAGIVAAVYFFYFSGRNDKVSSMQHVTSEFVVEGVPVPNSVVSEASAGNALASSVPAPCPQKTDYPPSSNVAAAAPPPAYARAV